MNQFAKVISRIFDPILIISSLTILAAIISPFTSGELIRFILVFGLVMVMPPIALLVWSIFSKRVSGWDVGNRKQRVYVLLALIGFLLFDYLLVLSFHNAMITDLFMFYLVWFIGFFLITLFWKISGHVGILTFAIGLLQQWFGNSVLPLTLLIPIVGWARVIGKNHSISQVIFGFFYSVILLFIHSTFS